MAEKKPFVLALQTGRRGGSGVGKTLGEAAELCGIVPEFKTIREAMEAGLLPDPREVHERLTRENPNYRAVYRAIQLLEAAKGDADIAQSSPVVEFLSLVIGSLRGPGPVNSVEGLVYPLQEAVERSSQSRRGSSSKRPAEFSGFLSRCIENQKPGLSAAQEFNAVCNKIKAGCSDGDGMNIGGSFTVKLETVKGDKKY